MFRGLRFQKEVDNTGNSIINCFMDVWEGFPVFGIPELTEQTYDLIVDNAKQSVIDFEYKIDEELTLDNALFTADRNIYDATRRYRANYIFLNDKYAGKKVNTENRTFLFSPLVKENELIAIYQDNLNFPFYRDEKGQLQVSNKYLIQRVVFVDAIKIIKEKKVDFQFLQWCKTVEAYNLSVHTEYQLTQQEFDLLKERLL